MADKDADKPEGEAKDVAQSAAPSNADAPSKRSLFRRIVPKSPNAAIQPVPVPPPPPIIRRERTFVNVVSGFLSLLLVLGLLGMGGAWFGYTQFMAPGPLSSDKVVVVRGGMADVASQLAREGVISSPLLFMAGLQATGRAAQIKAGEYLFPRQASLNEVANTLVEGKAILHAVTIPEGLTVQQIIERLMENDILVGEISNPPKEGSLLPDTYKFNRGMTRQQLLDRMAQEQTKIVREVWGRRGADLPLKSPQELVILASIVEKETGKADERTRVAGVFINRLNRNMRLQSDPTIVYGLVGGKGTLGRGIRKDEITQETPYNTYVINGLPPGPIANPGRAALEAVANPSRTRELFFVADGTGGHVFAETLDQHNRNVQRWRQIEGERRDQAPPADLPAQKSDNEAQPSAAPAAAPAPAPPQRGRANQQQQQQPKGRAGQQPAQAAPVQAAPAQAAPAPAAAAPMVAQPARPAPVDRVAPGTIPAGDPVAGTAKDPLLNRTFDLNSPKTVPPLSP